MPVAEHQVLINRPVTDIFRFMSDFNNNSKWQPASMSLDKAGKVRIGDMVVGKQRMLGRMQFVNADVIDISPNQKVVYKGVMGGYPFQTTYRYDFTGAGGTQVSIITELRIPWFMFFVRPFVMAGVDGQIATSLQNLKEYMENRRDLGS